MPVFGTGCAAALRYATSPTPLAGQPLRLTHQTWLKLVEANDWITARIVCGDLVVGSAGMAPRECVVCGTSIIQLPPVAAHLAHEVGHGEPLIFALVCFIITIEANQALKRQNVFVFAQAGVAEMEKTASGASGEDLTKFVNEILTEMQSKFSDMSKEIVGKIDKMGDRIDELEKQINDLMDQAGEGGDRAASAAAAGDGK